MSNYQKVLAQVKALPEKQRRQIANEIYDEPWSIFAPEVREEWKTEIRRRVKELDAGKMKTVPAEEVIARLRKRLK